MVCHVKPTALSQLVNPERGSHHLLQTTKMIEALIWEIITTGDYPDGVDAQTPQPPKLD